MFRGGGGDIELLLMLFWELINFLPGLLYLPSVSWDDSAFDPGSDFFLFVFFW